MGKQKQGAPRSDAAAAVFENNGEADSVDLMNPRFLNLCHKQCHKTRSPEK